MPEQTFEYCSLQYLNQWLRYDNRFCNALNFGSKDNQLAALKKAAGFYRVARNLRSEEKGLERYNPVLNILNSVNRDDFNGDPSKTVGQIVKIAGEISKKYTGERDVLSLTTKFLWLKIKSPILIYDKQARIALGIKKAVDVNEKALDGYYNKWHKEYAIYSDGICEACNKLPVLHLYSYAICQKRVTLEKIRETSSNQWFHERVFDMYLWNKGN